MIKIPFLSIPDAAIENSTQEHIPVADIIHDMVVYKNGGAALVLESTSLNFGLLSEMEQVAVIAGYAALLNSLNYTVQIVVRSEKKDISSYIKYLDKAEKNIQNQKLQNIMKGYKNFIVESIRKKNVLSKKFYLTIPFSPLELGVAKSFKATSPRKGPLPFPKSYVTNKARITLYPKRDHLVRQAARLGIRLTQLTNEDLLNLFYHYYNPEPPPKREEFQFNE